MRADDPLVDHYLDSSRVMRLATVSAKGATSLTPIWFVRRRGQMVSTTAASTVAARNVADDSRVTVLLDGEASGRSEMVLRLRGRAQVHGGLPPLDVLARFATKYYLSVGGIRSELGHVGRWALRSRYYAQSEAVWLTITPTNADLVHVPSVQPD